MHLRVVPHAVAVPADVDDVAVVDEPVDQRRIVQQEGAVPDTSAAQRVHNRVVKVYNIFWAVNKAENMNVDFGDENPYSLPCTLRFS